MKFNFIANMNPYTSWVKAYNSKDFARATFPAFSFSLRVIQSSGFKLFDYSSFSVLVYCRLPECHATLRGKQIIPGEKMIFTTLRVSFFTVSRLYVSIDIRLFLFSFPIVAQDPFHSSTSLFVCISTLRTSHHIIDHHLAHRKHESSPLLRQGRHPH